jgi:glutamate--cysteine ligase
MSDLLEKRLQALANFAPDNVLRGGHCGIEKESLRVTPDGYIAKTAHPAMLGSALTNKYITTDYSEALLEFVTPPVEFSWEAIQYLCDIHQFAHEAIGDELLWAFSMPCMIRSEADIPLANYGTSNVGTMKTAYRRGLGYRYGRRMQAIAGIHFNYSLPESFWPVFSDIESSTAAGTDFRSDRYLGLVRNVRRFDWLLLYLFGASPAVCKSFLSDTDTDLEELDSGTLYGQYATSLRMSGIGYQSSSQALLDVSANTLDEYVRDLEHAVQTPNPEYMKIGVKVGSEFRQLNANFLQIENEFYSTIRPKRVARSGERPTEALRRRGVEYVELRALDLNPFDPVGINQSHIRFLELFSIYCLLNDSPPIAGAERSETSHNNALVAGNGRKPGLELQRHGSLVTLQEWGQEICQGIGAVAEIMDAGQSTDYRQAVQQQIAKIENPELTPSAQLMSELRDTGQPMFSYAMSISRQYADYFRDLAPEMNSHYDRLKAEAVDSVERQASVEKSDTLSFEQYLERYFS